VAPVLQCPDCGSKHPLGEVPESGAFPCKGCGRVLKVPERVAQTARPEAAPTRVETPVAPARVEAPVPPPVTAEPSATAAMPVVETNPRPAAVAPTPASRPIADRKPLGKVPMWMRFLLWIVAVPLAFIIVFVFARAFGVFTSSQLSDVFLASDADRFWPVARVLPFVALVTAVIVQAGVYAIARLRGGRSR
jgi:hypothetical protein